MSGLTTLPRHVEDVRAERRYRAVLLGFFVAVSVLVLVMLSFLVIIANEAHDQRDRLIDCTTPGHQCFDDAQQRGQQMLAALEAQMDANHAETLKEIRENRQQIKHDEKLIKEQG